MPLGLCLLGMSNPFLIGCLSGHGRQGVTEGCNDDLVFFSSLLYSFFPDILSHITLGWTV